MFYRNSLKGKSAVEKRIQLSNFSGGINTTVDEYLLPQTTAKMCYNVSGKTGALTHSSGIEQLYLTSFNNVIDKVKLPLDKQVLKMWYFKRTDASGVVDDRLMILGEDMQLYNASLVDFNGVNKVEGVLFSSIPTATNYRLGTSDVIIMSSPTDSMIVYNGIDAPNLVASAPKLTSMCVHYERLFATTPNSNTLWFSDDLDPTNWNIALDAAGYIEMADEKGSLLKVISFLDYVYVFRTHGIARVSAYTDQAQFAVSQLFSTSGKIYADTVTVCGDKILFLSDDGLYAFDGMTASKVLNNMTAVITNDNNINACGCYYLGKYYLSTRINYNDNCKVLCEASKHFNNSLLEVSLNDGSIAIMRGVDIPCMLPLNNDNLSMLLLATRYDKVKNSVGKLNDSGRLYDRILPKSWTCPSTMLNAPDRIKRLKKIYILTKYDLTINIIVDGVKNDFFVRASDSVNKIKVNLSGNIFNINFSAGTEKMFVTQPLLLYSVT